MKIIFVGTTDFAVPSLQQLSEKYGSSLKAVFTQPARPKGRGRKVEPTPIALAASECGLPVFAVENINEASVLSQIKDLQPDLIIVIAFGQKIGEELLMMPRLGAINLHASLLPLYRGANPIQRAILNGEKETGVTTMFMDVNWDSGPILLQKAVKIGDMTYGQMAEALASEGALLLLETIEKLSEGILFPKVQNKEAYTTAPKLKDKEKYLDFSKDAALLAQEVRALNPSPLARMYYKGIELKVWLAREGDGERVGEIGEILVAEPKKGLIIQTGKGQLEILELQQPGRKRMSSKSFLLGFDVQIGDIIEGGTDF